MNKTARIILALAAIFSVALLVILSSVQARAAEVDQSSAVLNATIDTAAAVAQPFIVTFVQKYPWLITVLAAMGTLRLVFKPLVSAVEMYVKSTPGSGDDEWVAKAQHSAAFKAFAWLLDYLGSIKVGPQFTAKPKAEPAAAS